MTKNFLNKKPPTFAGGFCRFSLVFKGFAYITKFAIDILA